MKGYGSVKNHQREMLCYKTIAVNGSTFLLYQKGALHISRDSGKHISFLADMPLAGKTKYFAKVRLLTRLFRLEPRAASVIDDKRFLISYAGKAYIVDVEKKTVEIDFAFRKRMNNPLAFVRVNHVSGFEDGIYFGEYFSNNDREEVCIYRRSAGKWEKVFAFPKGAIYHIHGIVPDQERECLYILTGDEDHESAIWEAKDNFKQVEPILIGKQQYRACVAFPWDGGILYASDTAREQNHIYHATQVEDTWQIKEITRLPGPCIYGVKNGDECYFATSVEPDEDVGSFRYRFTYKLGKGVRDRKTHIISIGPAGNTKDIFQAQKDILPMLLFQFGNCLFPAMENTNKLIVCPISVFGYDGKTIVLSKDL